MATSLELRAWNDGSSNAIRMRVHCRPLAFDTNETRGCVPFPASVISPRAASGDDGHPAAMYDFTSSCKRASLRGSVRCVRRSVPLAANNPITVGQDEAAVLHALHTA